MKTLDARLFGLLAMAWGALLIYFYYSTRVSAYLDVSFHHFIMIGGVGMVVLGLYALICPRDKNHHHDHHDHDDQSHDYGHHDHDHDELEVGNRFDAGEPCEHEHAEGHGPVVTILLTIVPLTLAMAHTRDSLSNSGLSKKGLYESPNLIETADLPPFTREDLEKNVPRNEHGEFQLRMISAYYAAGDREIQDIFDGLPVELEGRIAPEKLNNESGDRLRIFRSIITCCAADIQVVGVSLEFPGDSKKPEPDDWVKAGGTLTFETIDGEVYPLLKVREVIPAEEPYSEFRRRQ